ncbi:hypothetical protein [Nitrospira sp. Nam74]
MPSSPEHAARVVNVCVDNINRVENGHLVAGLNPATGAIRGEAGAHDLSHRTRRYHVSWKRRVGCVYRRGIRLSKETLSIKEPNGKLEIIVGVDDYAHPTGRRPAGRRPPSTVRAYFTVNSVVIPRAKCG